MTRGFKEVSEKFKQYEKKVTAHGETHVFYPSTKLPVRSDARSAGYDFHTPVDFSIPPRETFTIWTNVKAYMQEDEYLALHVRSSIGTKQNVTLANVTGIVDSSYFENGNNDGNIGLVLRNNSGVTVSFKAGDRIAQGVFSKYLIADQDAPTSDTREGGFGSSGK